MQSKYDQDVVQKNVDMIKANGEASVFFRPYKSKQDIDTNDLLFVYQMQRLLGRYLPDAPLLLDATHKTSQYPFPLFFLDVKTKVDYQVVGLFIT